MALIDKVERKLSWLAFPGLFKSLTILGVLVYGLSWTRPDIGMLLDFNKTKMLEEDQWWRLVTFPFASQGMGRPSVVSLLFFLCAVSFSFTISDGLERVWGTTRTTLFLLLGLFCLLAANWLANGMPFSGALLYGTAFLAFAWHFPDYPLRLLFVIPVPCHFLAKVQLAALLLLSVFVPLLIPFLLLAHVNLLIWVAPEAWKALRLRAKAGAKRGDFRSKLRPASQAFHTCAVCGRTEHHKPELEFRIGGDGQEYCSEHLPK